MRRTETPKPIWIKFGMLVDIPDVVTYTNFGDHRLRGFWVAGGSNFPVFHWLSSSPLQHSRTTMRVCDIVVGPCLWFISWVSRHGHCQCCCGPCWRYCCFNNVLHCPSDTCRESSFGSTSMFLVTYQEQTLKLVSLIHHQFHFGIVNKLTYTHDLSVWTWHS